MVGQTFLSDPSEQAGMPVLPDRNSVCQTFLSDTEIKRLYMKIPKAKAVELIDEKIEQFEKIAISATYENRYKEEYQLTYEGTETLLTELFSEKEAMNFRIAVQVPPQIHPLAEFDPRVRVLEYMEHINKCVTKLKVYRERIDNFWPSDEIETTSRTSIVPFVAMSFDGVDKDLNEYITGVLKALHINFVTGEPYSKKSIPEKVQERIANCGLIISIFVRRDEIKDGGYTTPPWLVGEVKYAQGKGKDVIAWVEKGIKDIAGLNLEKELIYFVRDDVK